MRLLIVFCVALLAGLSGACLGREGQLTNEEYSKGIAEWKASNPGKEPTPEVEKAIMEKAKAKAAEIIAAEKKAALEKLVDAAGQAVSGNIPGAIFTGVGAVLLYLFGAKKTQSSTATSGG